MKALRLAALATLIACSVGCKKPSSDTKVAFLLSTLQEERYQKDKRYFVDKAEQLGLDVIALAADNDNAKQLAQVEDALTRGAKVLVIQPTDSKAASAYVALAHRSGAKVVAYDRAIVSADLDYYVAHDSYRVGVLQAEAAIDATGGKGSYVILSGQAGHSVASEITRGYRDTLRAHTDRGSIRIVAEQSHSAWAPEQALRTVEDAIAKSGKLTAILANNSGMARGAVQAIDAADLEDVFVAGADADAANVNYVCAGKQSVEVLKDIQPLAETAAQVAASLATGTEIDAESAVELDGSQVPTSAVRVALVTPETVKSTVVDSGFLTPDEIPACADKLARKD